MCFFILPCGLKWFPVSLFKLCRCLLLFVAICSLSLCCFGIIGAIFPPGSFKRKYHTSYPASWGSPKAYDAITPIHSQSDLATWQCCLVQTIQCCLDQHFPRSEWPNTFTSFQNKCQKGGWGGTVQSCQKTFMKSLFWLSPKFEEYYAEHLILKLCVQRNKIIIYL